MEEMYNIENEENVNGEVETDTTTASNGRGLLTKAIIATVAIGTAAIAWVKTKPARKRKKIEKAKRLLEAEDYLVCEPRPVDDDEFEDEQEITVAETE